MGVLPGDIAKQVSNNCEDRELRSLSQVNNQWKAVCEEEMSGRLADELECFRTNYALRCNADLLPQMSASKEIEHYLNGFDLRMYDWMMAFHRRSDNAAKQQIEEFATKLAQNRSTYPRPPPHRRGQQEEIPLFDAFIRMRDKNMEILQNRMKNDHIMFDDYIAADPLSTERSAMIQMMKIMETIGIEIGYPGVQEMMQKNGGWFGFWRYNKLQVQDLLVGTVDIRQLEYNLFDGKNRVLMEVLSRESCVGRKAADDIVENLEAFVRDLAHWKLVTELERFRSIAQRTPGMSLDFMKDASQEIEHYLNGFDSRMSHAIAILYSKSDFAVKHEIDAFAINLAQYRATYPRPPAHPMDMQSDWTVGQDVRNAVAHRDPTGSRELRFGEDTLSGIDVTVQIDALYHYPARTQKDKKQPLEKYLVDVNNSQLPITIELRLKPGSTFRSFAESLRSHLVNKLPIFRADDPEDILLSITPEAESSTVRALQSQGIGLELKRVQKISTWSCGNAAFFFRANHNKQYAQVQFSVKGPSPITAD